MTNSQLHKYILATLVYYDGLDYPLTAFEIWKNLIRTDYSSGTVHLPEIKMATVMKELGSEPLLKFLECSNGFYFLKGRNCLVGKRSSCQKISAGKLRRLQKITFWLRYVPFVRMIGVTGGLAMKNAHAKSDWDLLIVLKAGHIWTGRTLVTLFAHLIGKRRYSKKVANRLCLNYFITDSSLEVMTKDLFSANEYMYILPLFGGGVYHRFQIKNQWIKKMKPTYDLQEIPPLKLMDEDPVSTIIKGIGELLFGWKMLENILRKLEKKRIMENPKTHQEGSLVYAGDDALIFLPSPHGPSIFEKFKEKMEQMEIVR